MHIYIEKFICSTSFDCYSESARISRCFFSIIIIIIISAVFLSRFSGLAKIQSNFMGTSVSLLVCFSLFARTKERECTKKS